MPNPIGNVPLMIYEYGMDSARVKAIKKDRSANEIWVYDLKPAVSSDIPLQATP